MITRSTTSEMEEATVATHLHAPVLRCRRRPRPPELPRGATAGGARPPMHRVRLCVKRNRQGGSKFRTAITCECAQPPVFSNTFPPSDHRNISLLRHSLSEGMPKNRKVNKSSKGRKASKSASKAYKSERKSRTGRRERRSSARDREIYQPDFDDAAQDPPLPEADQDPDVAPR